MKVLTPSVNNPIFIEIQYKTLKKYMMCDYEFIVFNDAKEFSDFTNGGDVTVSKEIENTCKRLGIVCIKIDNNKHSNMSDAAIRCADSYNSILEFQKENKDKYLVLDSDMFLIDYFNPESYYEDFSSAVVLQSRDKNSDNESYFGLYNNQIYCTDSICNYIWNGIFYFDMNKITNQNMLNWDCIGAVDVGGAMCHWLNTQVNEPLHYIQHLSSCSWDLSEIPDNLKNDDKLVEFLLNDPRNTNGKFFCEIYDNKFLHYRAGGNWRGEGLEFHKDLSNKLYNIF